jgi:hypothetical protein
MKLAELLIVLRANGVDKVTIVTEIETFRARTKNLEKPSREDREKFRQDRTLSQYSIEFQRFAKRVLPRGHLEERWMYSIENYSSEALYEMYGAIQKVYSTWSGTRMVSEVTKPVILQMKKWEKGLVLYLALNTNAQNTVSSIPNVDASVGSLANQKVSLSVNPKAIKYLGGGVEEPSTGSSSSPEQRLLVSLQKGILDNAAAVLRRATDREWKKIIPNIYNLNLTKGLKDLYNVKQKEGFDGDHTWFKDQMEFYISVMYSRTSGLDPTNIRNKSIVACAMFIICTLQNPFTGKSKRKERKEVVTEDGHKLILDSGKNEVTHKVIKIFRAPPEEGDKLGSIVGFLAIDAYPQENNVPLYITPWEALLRSMDETLSWKPNIRLEIQGSVKLVMGSKKVDSTAIFEDEKQGLVVNNLYLSGKVRKIGVDQESEDACRVQLEYEKDLFEELKASKRADAERKKADLNKVKEEAGASEPSVPEKGPAEQPQDAKA